LLRAHKCLYLVCTPELSVSQPLCVEMFGKIMVVLTLIIGELEFYWYGYRPKHVEPNVKPKR